MQRAAPHAPRHTCSRGPQPPSHRAQAAAKLVCSIELGALLGSWDGSTWYRARWQSRSVALSVSGEGVSEGGGRAATRAQEYPTPRLQPHQLPPAPAPHDRRRSATSSLTRRSTRACWRPCTWRPAGGKLAGKLGRLVEPPAPDAPCLRSLATAHPLSTPLPPPSLAGCLQHRAGAPPPAAPAALRCGAAAAGRRRAARLVRRGRSPTRRLVVAARPAAQAPAGTGVLSWLLLPTFAAA